MTKVCNINKGLTDTKEMVNKFVNREQTYSELLISIADYEKKIAHSQKVNEQLKATIQSLKDRNQPIERTREEKNGVKSELSEV